ncbi:GPI ethanolamine phosphate transferase 1 isoform X2 [Aphidius gifuensis]|nr:GPI ethanolamine phosphate transferase 1 isoform X2 [Aphidius gifuensis]
MKHGTWGISHTRMPTESRPGNVAITAGLYEDPSALFRGWKENPVHFDSVFNQSRKTWAWGSPDIVPMFTKGNKKNVYGETYPHDWQDFDKASNSPRRLDSWVFDKYFTWLKNDAPSVKNDCEIILFFHLLGCDTAGHGSKPHSSEYIESMNYVDNKIQQVVKSAEIFFGDNQTTFIMTADHGMTDWGSHGSGSTDETETPFVAWGAGINDSLDPVDIHQADIAPLISTLLGISIPVNSEGILRSQYLKYSSENFTARAMINNFKQMENQIKASRILTSGYGKRKIHQFEEDLHKTIKKMKQLVDDKNNNAAMSLVDDGIRLSKNALYYYRRYQTNQLIIYLSFMWLGWIFYLLFTLAGLPRKFIKKFHGIYLTTYANFFAIVSMIILVVEHLVSGRGDWRVVQYGIMTIISILLAAKKATTHSLMFEKNDIITLANATIGITLLILLMSIGLLKKYFFSLAMIVAVSMQYKFTKKHNNYLIITGLLLAIYPLLPTVRPGTDIIQILGVLIVHLIFLYKQKSIEMKIKLVEFLRILLTSLIVAGIIDGRTGVSWIILLSSPVTILLYPVDNAVGKLTGVMYGFLCPISLLSASYEPQFFSLLALHLIKLQESITFNREKVYNTFNKFGEQDKKYLSPEDLVTAAYFMLYILLSFFGTGNMASISSFDPMWTKHFITVFSPFIMSSLIVLKLAIPLILIGCASQAITSSSSSSSVFLAVLLLGDCLSLPLMYTVTSEGSWLDIGSAISRYTIAVILPCLFMILYYLSKPFMTFCLFQIRTKTNKHHSV